MAKRIEDIRVTDITRIDRCNSTNPHYQEFIIGKLTGGQDIELTRFYSPGEAELVKGNYYRGWVSPAPPPDSNNPQKKRTAKFELKSAINEFGGIEIPFNELPASQSMDDRQRLIILQALMKDIACYYKPKSDNIPFLEIMDELPPAYEKLMQIAKQLKAEEK